MRFAYVAFLCCAAFVLAGCLTRPTEPTSPRTLEVIIGVPPLAFLVEQIGQTRVRVDSLVQPGQDPHTFEPTPQQILALSRATLFFEIGMPFESVLLEKIKEGNPRLTIVDATRGIKKRPWNTSCCASDADHGHEHESDHEQPDPHVWLALPLLKTLAENIAAELIKIDPTNQADYTRNLHELLERIDRQHDRIREELAPFDGRSFYVFHPGFGYFADTYGLKEQAVEIGGQAPTAKQLREIVAKAQHEKVTTVFVQPQYAPQGAQAVAEAVGARVVTINGLDKDVLADIDDIAAKIAAALGEEK